MIKGISDKQKELSNEIFLFEQSNRGVGDYMLLFVTLNKVLKPDNGLVWHEVESAIKDALQEVS